LIVPDHIFADEGLPPSMKTCDLIADKGRSGASYAFANSVMKDRHPFVALAAVGFPD
jgi:hypothetical protein